MTDYEQIVEKIINSISNFSFEFDIESVKKEMELQEVSKDELEKLGENNIVLNFNKGVYKIKLPNGNLIDSGSIKDYSIKNNIKEPVIFINPNFKYVQWILKKDFATPQIKKRIKNLLTTNTDINLSDVQKALLIEDIKNKKVEGYIDNLPVKTSNYISNGKFHFQSSCSRESAIQMVHEVINELTIEKKIYVNSKIKRDFKNILLYLTFVIFICCLWYANQQSKLLLNWFSNTIGLLLFLIPLIVMRLINHSIFDTLFFRKKAERKYEKEFDNKIIS